MDDFEKLSRMSLDDLLGLQRLFDVNVEMKRSVLAVAIKNARALKKDKK